MTTVDDTARLAQMRRALFEQRVRGAGSPPAAEARPVMPRPAAGPLPLPASQAQLWYLSQLAPDSCAYNEMIEIRKVGALDVQALRRALNAVVSRHETWRTTFDCVDGVPHQFVHEPTEIDLPLVDLSHLGTEEAERRAVEIAAAEAVRPYDLTRGPFIRPLLVRITDDYHRLCLCMHHLIFDGVTMQRVLLPELIAAYRAYAAGEALSLPEPEVQYSDFIIWQQDWLSGPTGAARIARCRDRLADLTPAQLPVDYSQPAGQRSAGGAIPVTIEAATVEALTRAARSVGGTFFHALAAAHAWWLHRYTESTDVSFSSPHDLRYRKDLLPVAGYCATPVVVRCQVTGQETFIELVERMRGEVADAVSDVVPLQTLLAELGVPRDPRYNPLFQTALNLEPPMTSPSDEWSLHLMQSDIANAIGATKFDINVELDHRQEGHVVGRLFFSTDLFDPETARAMAQHWCRLLDVVAAAPELPMVEYDLITSDERRRQLDWNPTMLQGISTQSVHEVIGSQVERTPDAVAVQVADATLTYRQLDDRAAAIASRLAAAGAGPGAVVAVL
ncbi:MAG: condensation domain-containing protein, partial [Mycobacterium sp.]